MNLFFLIVFGFYFLLMLGLTIGWMETFVSKPDTELPRSLLKKICVIVPFRNEEHSLSLLILDLQRQRITQDVEIIFVNDHSQDDSATMVARLIEGENNFRMLSLPMGKEGKKQALNYGIEHSDGDIIVTTDADCRVPNHWLAATSNLFDNPKWMMVFGGVRIADEDNFFTKLQALEFSSLIGTAAATASLGFPTMCNGANLAFRRSAFIKVGGYVGNFDVPSGDDEFLMRKINNVFPGSISFLPIAEAVVETKALENRAKFIEQRIRWAGKWPYNTSRISQALALFVLVLQVSFLAIWFAPLWDGIDWRFGLLLVLLKMAFEYTFLYQVSSFLKAQWRPIHFLAMQFVYPVYVTYVGVASLFRSYEWKGRVGKSRLS